ncbi:hypothetical protein HYS47_04990 [Candidatus Woesearchaeota archaeon]|nr:hypothetical protein [Candidatus Woesearchaeota archaeon]
MKEKKAIEHKKEKKVLKILNSKEVKHIKAIISGQWGSCPPLDYVWLMNAKEKIYLVTRDIIRIDLSKLRVDSYGIYFGEVKNMEVMRLSIEGSQLIGPSATKNVIDVSKEHMRQWLKGEDLSVTVSGVDGFVIIKYQDDFLGCGKYKEGKILNHIPKTRRILAED